MGCNPSLAHSPPGKIGVELQQQIYVWNNETISRGWLDISMIGYPHEANSRAAHADDTR